MIKCVSYIFKMMSDKFHSFIVNVTLVKNKNSYTQNYENSLDLRNSYKMLAKNFMLCWNSPYLCVVCKCKNAIKKNILVLKAAR